MTNATAAASLHRHGTHRRLADRNFFTSLASIFGDDGGDDGDDGDDGGQSGDSGHDSGSKSSTCEYPFFLAQDGVVSCGGRDGVYGVHVAAIRGRLDLEHTL